MSIVSLSSEGQRPNNFTCRFPQSILLGRNAEVMVAGYSGKLIGLNVNHNGNAAVPNVDYIQVTEHVNDNIVIYHENADATRFDYAPRLLKIPAGLYTKSAFDTQLETTLELGDLDMYRWTVTENNDAYTLKCGQVTLDPQNAYSDGNFINYDGLSGGITGGGVTDLVGGTQTGVAGGNAYLATQRGFMGVTNEAVGYISANPGDFPIGWGFSFNFAGTETAADVAWSFGITDAAWATKCEYPLAPTDDKFGENYDSLLRLKTPETFDPNNDWCLQYTRDTTTSNVMGLGGRFIVGLKLMPVTNTSVNVFIGKSPLEGTKSSHPTVWTDTGVTIDLTVGGSTEFYLCPRADGNNSPVIEVVYSINGGAYVAGSAGTIPVVEVGNLLSNPYNYFRKTYRIAMGCIYDPAANSATSATLSVINLPPNAAITADPLVDGNSGLSVGFLPFPTDMIVAPELKTSGFTQECSLADIGGTFGFGDIFLSTATPETVGLVGDAIGTIGNSGTQASGTPLMITCPDLNINGYVGAAEGGGQHAPILGVMETTSNFVNDTTFSNAGGNGWIKLNNTAPLTLDRLNISIRDFCNRETNILIPNTHIWLKFKSEGPPCPDKMKISVGGFSYE